MRCLEAAFVMLLGWVFSFRQYDLHFEKNEDFYFANYRFPIRLVMFRFENYSRPRYVRIRKKKKATFKWWHKKPPKQGCMQTLDKNYEMLKKAYV